MSRVIFKPRAVRLAAMLLALVATNLLTACENVRAAGVDYYPGSGALTLDNSGANYDATLGSVVIYIYPTPPSKSTLDSLSDWTAYNTTGPTAHDIGWGGQTGNASDALAQGVYPLTTLAQNLTAAYFGYSLNLHGTTYPHGANDTTGAVALGDIQGGSFAYGIVNIERSVPSENDWTGAPNGSWNIGTNWSLSHSASAGETASFITSSLAGTISLNHNQSVGSLWFNSSSPYTIASGSGAYTLTLSNTASIWIDAGLHTISAPLAISGSLTVDADPASNVAPGSVGVIISGQLSGASALFKVDPGVLYLSNTNNLYNGNTSITGGTLSAAGAGSLGASGSVAISNATLEFSSAGSFSRGISLVGSGANTIQPDAGVMTLSGAISGPGGLTKAGNGTLAISNSGNSYAGSTNVLAGTLQLKAATALSSTSTTTIAGGATLDLDGVSPTLANIAGGGVVTNSNSSMISTLTAYAGGPASYAAAIQDGAGHIALNVPSGGLLTLSNTTNTFSGGSSVSGGTLAVSADGNLGGPTSGVALNNGALLLGGSGGLALVSGRAISLAGNSSIDVVAGQSAMIAGTVSGGTLTKTDGGTLALTGGNTYSGGTVINGGILAAANDSNLGGPGANVTINNATLQLGCGTSTCNILFGNGYPTLQVPSGTLTAAGLLSGGSNALQKTGAGTLVLTNASNSFFGINVDAGALLNNDPTGQTIGGGQVTVSGGTIMGSGTFLQPVRVNPGGNIMAGNANTLGVMTLQSGLTLVQGASAATWTLKIDGNGNSDSFDFGQVPGAKSTLAISGQAMLLVTGAPLPSTTMPYTIITDAQGLSPPPTNPVDTTKLIVKAPLGFTGSVFQNNADYFNGSFPDGLYTYSLSFTSATAWSVSGTGNWSTNSNWSNNVPVHNNIPLAGCTAMFGAAGSGAVVLPGSGTTTYVNTFVFANSSNSYTLSPGAGGSTLSFLHDSTAPAGGAIDQGGAFVEVVYGSATIAVDSQLNCGLNVSTLDPAAAMTFSGALSGAGSLTITGSGTLILSGSNTYSGGTYVEGGTLLLDNSDSFPVGSSLSVGPDAPSFFATTFSPVIPETSGGFSPSIASPVPEPGTLAIVIVGAIGCLAAQGWRSSRGRKRHRGERICSQTT